MFIGKINISCKFKTFFQKIKIQQLVSDTTGEATKPTCLITFLGT